MATKASTSFQSTPAFSGEGTSFFLSCPQELGGFNPPPPFQAREPRISRTKLHKATFQSTPAFSGEGTTSKKMHIVADDVSIHPRLFRRGNVLGDVIHLIDAQFQSTPAFSGEGTLTERLYKAMLPVSIHPRLFRRGNGGNR